VLKPVPSALQCIDIAAEEADILAKFADDTKVGKIIEDEADRAKLQGVLDRLCTWTAEWGMEFNVSKCKIMHIGKKKPKYAYEMEGQQLEQVDSERDIRIQITSNLKPSAQCAKAAATARAVL
jgi:hypothetical protein